MKYGYVCTNYNNSALTEAAILSLENNGLRPTRIVVVDNRSADAEVERLRRFVAGRGEVELIANETNIGYFPGLNIGLARLLELEPDVELVVIGNNDLEFGPDFGESLRQRRESLAQHPVVAPNIVTFEGIHQNPHAIRPVGHFRELVYDLYYSSYAAARLIEFVAAKTSPISARRDAMRHSEAGPIFMGIGACYILSRAFLDNFKSLWAPTFLMGEEYFLALQLARKGYSIYYEPGVVIRHREHASVREIPSRTRWSIARQAHRVYRQHVRPFRTNPAFIQSRQLSL